MNYLNCLTSPRLSATGASELGEQPLSRGGTSCSAVVHPDSQHIPIARLVVQFSSQLFVIGMSWTLYVDLWDFVFNDW
jgi:hypothetical protein